MSQQPQTTTLSELKKPVPPLDPSIKAGFDTVGGFDLIQRTAKLFAASSIVPQQFQGNLPNCVIAVDMALRMGANPLMVCQNLYIVHGRPAWSAQFLIATLNQCGRFTSIRYEFQGEEQGRRSIWQRRGAWHRNMNVLYRAELRENERRKIWREI